MADNNKRRFKGKRNTRGRKPTDERREKCDDRDDRRDQKGEPTGSLNDISWYSRYPDLLAAAGAFPYPYRPGMKVPLNMVTMTSTAVRPTWDVGSTIPGVLTIDWVPSVGKSNTATDPASIVCKEMYAKVRSVYSGSLDADAPDFLMYVMALDSIFAFIAHMKRIYRTMNVWTPQNYVLPDTLLQAYGCTPNFIEDIRSNQTAFWSYINELILQSRKFTCPAVMDIFNRHYWMSDNVYTDAPDINSQFYVFRMAGLFQYEDMPVAGETGIAASGLHMIQLPEFNTGLEMYTFGRGLIEKLVAWDDAYTINGYLSRAYDGTPSFTVAELPQNEQLVPVYVEEVLTQIENTMCVFGGDSTLNSSFWNPNATAATGSGTTVYQDVLSGCNVTQDVGTNAVISNPRIAIPLPLNYDAYVKGGYLQQKPTLSIRASQPTVADSVIASRLTAAMENFTITTITGGSNPMKMLSYDVIAGTEIPLKLRLFGASVGYEIYGGKMMASNITVPQMILGASCTVDSSLSVSLAGGNSMSIMPLLDLCQFDWHPFVFINDVFMTSPDSTSNAWRVSVIGDWHNATAITAESLKQLHRVCTYSEFNAFNA